MAVIKTYNGTGADCSGSTGATDRVLTLDNTAMTVSSGFEIYLDGLILQLTTDYTLDHKSTGTTITILTKVWDEQEIIVNYYYEGYSLGVSGVSGDFGLGPLSDFGVTATRTPVTMTTDFSGNKTYTDGTDEDIDLVLSPYSQKYDLDKSGLNKSYDAIAFLKSDATLNKYDKITYDSKVYRVDSVSVRDFNGTRLFHRAMLYFADE